jgi:hypothetical protein
MAKDRVVPRVAAVPASTKVPATGATPASQSATPNGTSGQRPGVAGSGQRPAVTSSGQRPAITASGQRPAVPATGQRPANGSAPQAALTSPVAAAERPVGATPDRRTAPQAMARPVASPRVVQTAPPAAATAALDGFELLRADPAIEQGAGRRNTPPGVQIEQTPTIEVPQVVAPSPAQGTIEQAPAPVQLESRTAAPSADRIELIHPDRSVRVEQPMVVEALGAIGSPVPVVSGSMDMPAPVRDFAQEAHSAPETARSRSRAPLFIGIGLAAAAAIGALVFFRKPAPPAPAIETRSAPAPVAQPAAPPAVVGAEQGTVVSEVAQGEEQGRSASGSRRRDTEPDPGDADGLEPPPPEVLPVAPSVKALTDAAALPTVEAEAPDLVNRKQALEQTVREIDSSMRRESGKSGGSTR